MSLKSLILLAYLPYSECPCHQPGTVNGSNICHPDSIGQCPCKVNVQGVKCDVCNDTYYDLQYSDPRGCKGTRLVPLCLLFGGLLNVFLAFSIFFFLVFSYLFTHLFSKFFVFYHGRAFSVYFFPFFSLISPLIPCFSMSFYLPFFLFFVLFIDRAFFMYFFMFWSIFSLLSPCFSILFPILHEIFLPVFSHIYKFH